jgi:hypothetical protein
MSGDLLRMLRGLTPGRVIARTEPEELNGVGVSTVYVNDLECQETALLTETGAIPVERYSSEEEALEGHAAWVEKVKAGIQRVTKLGYGRLIEPEEVDVPCKHRRMGVDFHLPDECG